MDRYVYVKSDDSDTYFADNKPYRFRVHLNTPLNLKGFWRVCLSEFYAQTGLNAKLGDQVLYVYCNFCKESIVFGELQPILRRLPSTKRNQWNYSFDSDFYIPLSKNNIYEMEFYIKGRNGELITQLDKPLMLTLHFKHYPFYLDTDEPV